VEWSKTYAPNCEGCHNVYENRTPPEDPPCETCRVELMVENKEAAMVYQRVRGQVIVMSNGMETRVIDLNYPAIEFVMDLYKVKNRVECFEKVVRVFHHFNQES